jgi:hypothetical protein
VGNAVSWPFCTEAELKTIARHLRRFVGGILSSACLKAMDFCPISYDPYRKWVSASKFVSEAGFKAICFFLCVEGVYIHQGARGPRSTTPEGRGGDGL